MSTNVKMHELHLYFDNTKTGIHDEDIFQLHRLNGRFILVFKHIILWYCNKNHLETKIKRRHERICFIFEICNNKKGKKTTT
jgi:hypothetical protein